MDQAILQAIMLVVAGFLLPYLLSWANVRAEKGKEGVRRKRAYDRLVGDNYVFEGARLVELAVFDRPEPLMRNCEIAKIGVGYVEIRSLEDGSVITFTGREFERLVPVFVSSKAKPTLETSSTR